MAIFLLIYIVFLIIWLIWSLIISYHLLKYRFPHDKVESYLMGFWLISIFILIVSIVFISRADWTTVPYVVK